MSLVVPPEHVPVATAREVVALGGASLASASASRRWRSDAGGRAERDG